MHTSTRRNAAIAIPIVLRLVFDKVKFVSIKNRNDGLHTVFASSLLK